MTRTAELLAVVLVAALVLTQVGKCAGKRDQSTEVALDNAYKLALSQRPLRDSVAKREAATNRVRTTVGRSSEGVSVADQALTLALDSAKAVLADQNATNAQLRFALQQTTERAESLQVNVRQFQASVDSLLRVTMEERYARQALQVRSDSTVRAYQEAVRKLDCRVLTLRCPSRMTSAGLGGLAILGLVLLL